MRRLPHQLVEAFRSTLEEVKQADLLIHLVDASDPDPQGQVAAVREVLAEIEAHTLPELLVLNKIDQVDEVTLARLRNLYPEAAAISASTGEGIPELLEALEGRLAQSRVMLHLEVPYERGDVVAAAHREGEVVAEKHESQGTLLDVRLPRHRVEQFLPFANGG